METTLIDDILIYLPEWTTQKLPPKDKRHREEIPSFIEEYPEKGEYKQYQYRKHIENREVLVQYEITRNIIKNYLHREHIPQTDDCYIATCMWTAGRLEEKYYGKKQSRLIKEAKTILEPYIKVYFRVLNKPPRPHHPHGYNPDIHYNSLQLHITSKEELIHDDTKTDTILVVYDVTTMKHEPIRLTAQVTGVDNTNVNDGEIQFRIAGRNIGRPCQVVGGYASLQTALPAHLQEMNDITGIYSNSTTYNDSRGEAKLFIHDDKQYHHPFHSFTKPFLDLKEYIEQVRRDILQRITTVETGTPFQNIFSKKNHTHQEYLTSNDTINNSLHLNGYTADSFASSRHNHSHMCYITPFKINSGVDVISITVDTDCVSHAIVLEDINSEIFTYMGFTDQKVVLEYNNRAVEGKLYHLLYYTTFADTMQYNTQMQLYDVEAGIGKPVELISVLSDDNNAPVQCGVVDYTLEGG
ncbi:MAG: hypothetical protein BZ136_07435 [Methanosphaera sp. rholeuAM74]|nr:MAG: hypothetical protein BZ136_07435 [Methanosphaera sp. rholeuAM74]